MDILPTFLSSVFVLLVLWSNSVTSGFNRDTKANMDNLEAALPAKRTYGSHVDGLSIAIGIGALIMGIACTESGECSPDEISQKIDDLSLSVKRVESQISTLQKDVSEIKQDTHLKWYLDLIDYVNSLKTKVSTEAIDASTNRQDLELRKKFEDQTLGVHRDDYVYKALFLIPTLIEDDKIIQDYLKYQKRLVNETEAAQRTCRFAQRMLDYQDDGYASLILGYALKFKDDQPAYNDALAETCTLWRNTRASNYTAKCTTLEDKCRHGLVCDRRQPLKTLMLDIPGLEECTLDNAGA